MLFSTPIKAVTFLLRHRHRPFSPRFFCKHSIDQQRRRFTKRMELSGLKPHHTIAMGISGGVDSMALCVLAAQWKINADRDAFDSYGLIDGLLAIIVNHGFRPESNDEAKTVSCWLTHMGIRSEIVRCDWPNGLPKLGHLEEMGRDRRYEIFRDVCFRHQIGVLLIAHHADDQAELFVLRMSRNSGVLGLAGMASTSQLFPKFPPDELSNSQGILVVRPLLEFTKEDLYKICEMNNQKWVEDPSNRSSLFARNRIRMALQDMNACTFRSELQALIAVCRRTRLYVDHICQTLLNHVVTIMPHGYVVIDLEKLNSSKVEDICFSRVLASVMQFVSQRHRPVRGSALKLLLDYIRTCPCKTSLTAAGCYLCAAPRTKGTKVLVCCSVKSSLPSKTDFYIRCPSQGTNKLISNDVEQIVKDQKFQSELLIPNSSDVHFLGVASSESVLDEARKLKIISESTLETIKELHTKETNLFRTKVEVESSSKLNNEQQVPAISDLFGPGQSFYVMNRFFLTWMSSEESNICNNTATQNQTCTFCMAHGTVAYVRHMIDEDWLYLAKLLKADDSSNLKQEKINLNSEFERATEKISLCSEYRRLSAEQALRTLKSIPVAVRRGLPVVVSTEGGILLNIPTIGFKHCPLLMISAQFRPRVPLGGGHSLFT